MDHEAVVRQKMTERYLLDELDPKIRDEFEEHFFDCPNCALDVRAGATFVEQSKIVLAENATEARTRVYVPARRPPYYWLRPALTFPILAVLLVTVAYQNLVTYPRLQQALNHPQVLPWASVNVGTFGSNGPVIATSVGKGFLLFVRIPPEDGYSSYSADLYDPAGKLQWSLTIPASSTQDQWPIQVPAANWEAGTYTLAVHGIRSSGESKDVGSTSFELEVQK
jgi:hypothetical protein